MSTIVKDEHLLESVPSLGHVVPLTISLIVVIHFLVCLFVFFIFLLLNSSPNSNIYAFFFNWLWNVVLTIISKNTTYIIYKKTKFYSWLSDAAAPISTEDIDLDSQAAIIEEDLKSFN